MINTPNMTSATIIATLITIFTKVTFDTIRCWCVVVCLSLVPTVCICNRLLRLDNVLLI
jgi:hypothetical protein